MREAQALQAAIDRIVRDRDAELLAEPHDQIAGPPAHDAIEERGRRAPLQLPTTDAPALHSLPVAQFAERHRSYSPSIPQWLAMANDPPFATCEIILQVIGNLTRLAGPSCL